MIIVASIETPMYRTLLQLTPDEMREVTRLAGTSPSAAPEEIIRGLSRRTGAGAWGLFPASTEDVLLDQVGRRLGMAPLLGGPTAIPQRERQILTCYFRMAWEGAPSDTRLQLLRTALVQWDHPSLPPPAHPDALSGEPDGVEQRSVLELLLQSSTGLRALALATEAVPLYLPRTAAAAPSLSIQIGPLSITGPGGTGHATLFGVLLLLWRARSRRLRDRRLQREALCRHLVGLEEQLSIRQRNVSGLPTPWNLRPASALAVAAGAISACLLQSVVGGTTELALALEFLVGVGSLGWAGFSLALQGGPPPDGRIGQLAGDVEAYRTQIAQVEREIILLDSE